MKNLEKTQAVMNSEILPKWKEVEEMGRSFEIGRLKGSCFFKQHRFEALVKCRGWCKNQPTNNYLRKNTLSIEMDNVSWTFHCFRGMFWKHLEYSHVFSFKLQITLPRVGVLVATNDEKNGCQMNEGRCWHQYDVLSWCLSAYSNPIWKGVMMII